MTHITVTVDGAKYVDQVEPRLLLVHYLREVVGKTGTPVGCDTSNCGACTVLWTGCRSRAARCLPSRRTASDITTIEGLANGELHPMQRAFHEEHALQCGYCTPGMIMAAADLLRDNPHPTERRSARAGGQSLPLHRLREHRPRGQARGRRGGDRMTATIETPIAEIGRARAAQGRRPAHHRPDQLDRQHQAARHAAHRVRCAARSRTPRSPGWTSAARSISPASSPRTPAPTSPPSRAACPARGRSRRTSSSRRTRRWRSTRSATWARPWPGRRARPVHRRGRASRLDRRGLRAAAAGTGHAHRAGRGLAEGARGGQQVLRVGLRQRRPRRGVPRRAGGGGARPTGSSG